jgi:hypothetical protein
MPSISSQFPVKLSSGAVWLELRGQCAECGGYIDDGYLRGCISRPIPDVAVVEAVGVCRSCRVLTPFLYRLHHDMRISGVIGGKWLEWKCKPSWVNRLRRIWREAIG